MQTSIILADEPDFPVTEHSLKKKNYCFSILATELVFHLHFDINPSPLCSFTIFSWLPLPPLRPGAHSLLSQPHVGWSLESPLGFSQLPLPCPTTPTPTPTPGQPQNQPPNLDQHSPKDVSLLLALCPLPSALSTLSLYFPPSIGDFLCKKNKVLNAPSLKILFLIKDTFSLPCCFLKLLPCLPHFPLSCQSSLNLFYTAFLHSLMPNTT